MADAVIETAGLSKSFGARLALACLDLRIAGGELVALVGENGAGKTTALGMLSGQLVPDGGHACIGGHDVHDDPLAARRLLGYVGQDVTLPPHLTTEEMAGFACAVKQVPFDRGELNRLLDLCGLEDDGDRLVGELSSGMQRKAAWVVALVTEPRALVLDEGLSGLDAVSAQALVREVGRRLDAGLAVLWAEHDLRLIVERLSGVTVLHGGRVTERAPGDAVRQQVATGELEQTMRRWTGEV